MTHDKRVALYCRVSTKDQDCARQVADLTRWATRMEWTVVASFTESASGAKRDRKVRAAVIAGAKAHDFDAILVTEPSRWSRSLVDLVTGLEELSRYGVSLLSQNGMSLDISTATGRMLVGVMGSLAEFERDLIRERIISGMAHKKAQGGYIGGRIAGNAPTQKRIAAEVRRMRDAGTPWRTIATALNVSHNTAIKAYSNPAL
jgi:DNA invertase Pin-like site-specific DNA recombinase